MCFGNVETQQRGKEKAQKANCPHNLGSTSSTLSVCDTIFSLTGTVKFPHTKALMHTKIWTTGATLFHKEFRYSKEVNRSCWVIRQSYITMNL